jgi:hypothetical protein
LGGFFANWSAGDFSSSSLDLPLVKYTIPPERRRERCAAASLLTPISGYKSADIVDAPRCGSNSETRSGDVGGVKHRGNEASS